MDSPAHLICARARALAVTGRPCVIAIDGRAGAGKTTVAAEVARLLDDAPLVHMDDLYAGWGGASQGSHLLVTRILRPLRRGQDASYNRYDWEAKAYVPEATSVPARDFLVVEGVLASYADARPLVDLAVWLDAPEKVRKPRALARDGEIFAPRWERWAELEDAHFGPDHTAEMADLIIDTSREENHA